MHIIGLDDFNSCVNYVSLDMRFVKPIVIIVVNTILLLLVVNAALVYYSPHFVFALGGAGISKLRIEKCYRTFAHDNLSKNKSSYNNVLVLGDSYSEGMGDEFLGNSDNYGLIRKLGHQNIDYIVAGRSGYGTIGAYNEASACLKFLDYWTSWSYAEDKISKVLLMFYEGNDLNNNLVELKQMSLGDELSTKRKRRILFPVFKMISTAVGQLVQREEEPNNAEETPVNVTTAGIEIPIAVQAAATELGDNDMETALGAVFDVLKNISIKYKNAQIDLLYIPSVASSYDFDEVKIQTYQGGPSLVGGEENRARSQYIRNSLRSYCKSSGGCNFCDTTEKIQSYTITGRPVHGPLDWKHFNKDGYSLVADAYRSCLTDQ